MRPALTFLMLLLPFMFPLKVQAQLCPSRNYICLQQPAGCQTECGRDPYCVQCQCEYQCAGGNPLNYQGGGYCSSAGCGQFGGATPQPFGYCGDGFCTGTCASCPADCGACPIPPSSAPPTGYCGDGACNHAETCSTCGDCGPCTGSYCGDGACVGDENCAACADDCGACATNRCGDGFCSAGERCDTCPGDCGACSCGDGLCRGSESCSTCANDCGACATSTYCGDGVCNAFEGCLTCAADCGACASSGAWWQVINGHAYAGQTAGVAMQAAIPSASTCSGSCIPFLMAPDTTHLAQSFGFPLTGGGSLAVNGAANAANVVATDVHHPKIKEGYDFFYREYSLGLHPSDDFINSADDAAQPTLPPAEGKTAYFHAGTLTIQRPWQVKAGEQVVIFVQGDLVMTNPEAIEPLITVAPSGFLAFIVSGDIMVEAAVGNTDPATTTPILEGVYIADGTLTIASSDDPTTEKRFIGAGNFIGWGGVILQRDLGVSTNVTLPAEQFIFRPDFIQYVPARMARPRYIWQETN